MAIERSTVFEAAQIGAESLAAPGVAVAADRRLQAVGLMLKPQIEVSRYRPFGFKYDTQLIPGKDFTQVDVSGRLDYNNVIYPLASILGSPDIATLGTNGRTWTFTSYTTAPDLPQTYTVESGSVIRAQRTTNVLFTELGLSFRRDAVEMSGQGLGKLFTDNVNMTGDAVFTLNIDDTVTGGTFTLTHSAQTTAAIDWDATADEVRAALVALSTIGPADVVVLGGPQPASDMTIRFTGALGKSAQTLTGTFTGLTADPGTSAITSAQAGAAITEIEALPVIPGNINVFVDSTSAALGTTKLTRVFSADFQISGRFNPMWTLNSSETSWAAFTEGPPEVTVRIKMAADGTGMDFLNTIRDGDTVFLRIESTGDALPAPDAGQNYLFRWDMAAKLERPDDLADNEGALAVDWTFRAVHDSTYGKMGQAVVQNLRTAL